MILDKENLFSDHQAVTATAAATNIVDLGPGDAGPSENISLAVMGAPFTGGGSLAVELKTADDLDAGRTSLVSPVTVATFSVSAAACAAGGKLVGARVPHGLKRYATLNYVATGTLAGGNITAGLTPDVPAGFSA